MSNLVGVLTLRASAALTASATGTTTSAATLNRPSGSPTGNTGLQRGAAFTLDCTTSSGTNRRLLVQVLGQHESGDTLFPIPGLVFGAVTSTGIETISYRGALPANLFCSATVAGTGSPSFTFSLKATALG